MGSVRPPYINVYQRILTANKYTLLNFACLCTCQPREDSILHGKVPKRMISVIDL